MQSRRLSLRTELLFTLGILAAAALAIGVTSVVVLIAPNGFPISCAIPAASRPTLAIFSDCRRRSWKSISLT